MLCFSTSPLLIAKRRANNEVVKRRGRDSSLSKTGTLQHSARNLMAAAGDGFDGGQRSSRGRWRRGQ
ncbi:unnamed protein product [Linum trigynum]|uniref:Uncharacterized protein n=1 Tax=Linum trigynum TaxID=586398 RepID=A0AAV2ESJ1_9ROSI